MLGDYALCDFTRGVMDRIREHCRVLDPEGWEEADALPLIGDGSEWVAKRHHYKTEMQRRHREIRAKQMRELAQRKLPQKNGLPIAPFLSSVQQLITFKAAHNRFRDADEDREDFVQEVYALAWKSWVDGGFKQFGADDRPDIYALDLLIKTADHAVRGRRRKECLLTSEEEESLDSPFKTAMAQAFGEILDSVPSKNPKVASQHRAWRFLVMPSATSVRFTYDDLEELTGMTRSSIARTRSLDRPVDLYRYNEKLYGRLVDIEREHNLTPAAARHRSERVRLIWDEPKDLEAIEEKRRRAKEQSRPPKKKKSVPVANLSFVKRDGQWELAE